MGGILFTSGMQTSCELFLLDSNSAVISAECMFGVGVDQSSKPQLEVYINGNDDIPAVKHAVESITYHNEYNSTTMANNVVLLQFNTEKNVTWQNPLGIIPDYYGGELVYVRHVLDDVDKMEWGTPRTLEDTSTTDASCDEMSEIYKYNNRNFKCSSKLVASPSTDLTSCSIPYGIVYARSMESVYLLGYHSHTGATRSADNACNYLKQRSYFLLIPDFIYTMQNLLGRDLKYTKVKNSNAPLQDITYQMDTSKVTGNNNGYEILSGDFYKYRGEKVTLPSDTSDSDDESLSETGNDSNGLDTSIDTNTSDSLSNDSSHDNSLRRNYILIGVFSGIGLLVIGTIAIILRRKWRTRRAMGIDPMGHNNLENALAEELGGATVPGVFSDNTDRSVHSYNHDPPPCYYEPPSTPSTEVVSDKLK
ncbi:hypothetical protein GGH19_002634 [Coemansia sp. RSA 1807]|nr:hypothetical protein GGF48_002079 [Coemansia sp. RSA 921]KAJ2270052.1 hypothetical protein EV176_004415 [Coemansia sp. RSA 451]KAJ2575893.1 hypothetical protein GGH19_002634 [Coemansia sp. RSA 1807]